MRFAGLEIGYGGSFSFVIDFDTVDFASKWDVADHDVFGEEATFGFGVRVANLVAALGEELFEFAIAAKMELFFFVLFSIGFVNHFMELGHGVIVADVFLINSVHDLVNVVAIIKGGRTAGADANDVVLEEFGWASIFEVDEGVEMGWRETVMLDFW